MNGIFNDSVTSLDKDMKEENQGISEGIKDKVSLDFGIENLMKKKIGTLGGMMGVKDAQGGKIIPSKFFLL